MKHESKLKAVEMAQIKLREDAIKEHRREIRRLKEKARGRARREKESAPKETTTP